MYNAQDSPHTQLNYPPQNVNSAEVEKPQGRQKFKIDTKMRTTKGKKLKNWASPQPFPFCKTLLRNEKTSQILESDICKTHIYELKCSQTDECRNKLRYNHTMESYSAINMT